MFSIFHIPDYYYSRKIGETFSTPFNYAPSLDAHRKSKGEPIVGLFEGLNSKKVIAFSNRRIIAPQIECLFTRLFKWWPSKPESG